MPHNALMANRRRKNLGFTADPDLEKRLREYLDQRKERVQLSEVVAAGLVIFFHDLDDADRVSAIDRGRNYDLEMGARRSEGPKISEASRKRIRQRLASKKSGHRDQAEAAAS